MQILRPIHCFLCEIQIIKNGFSGPLSYRVFRETGPGGPFLEGPEKFSGLQNHF